ESVGPQPDQGHDEENATSHRGTGKVQPQRRPDPGADIPGAVGIFHDVLGMVHGTRGRLSSPSAPSRPARVLTRRFRPSPMAGNGRERLVPLLVSLRRFVTRCRRSQTLGKPKTAADKPLPPRRHRLGDLLNAYRITSLARSNRPPGVRGPV